MTLAITHMQRIDSYRSELALPGGTLRLVVSYSRYGDEPPKMTLKDETAQLTSWSYVRQPARFGPLPPKGVVTIEGRDIWARWVQTFAQDEPDD